MYPPPELILKKSDGYQFFLTGYLGEKKVCRTVFFNEFSGGTSKLPKTVICSVSWVAGIFAGPFGYRYFRVPVSSVASIFGCRYFLAPSAPQLQAPTASAAPVKLRNRNQKRQKKNYTTGPPFWRASYFIFIFRKTFFKRKHF